MYLRMLAIVLSLCPYAVTRLRQPKRMKRGATFRGFGDLYGDTTSWLSLHEDTARFETSRLV
ncbi:hypothetical protein SCLCIDRAFT_1209210 [Scleroderma citrinum Foug A]|uniref:Uncharacterized protein n=1 Tax=Scleroderma citrinum Foug A TaxID=1036808 RepID=A0A0C3ATV0_9AGAM|nr:hypothetical protein SCLCIDRAFT_1209210 [Scleroderma citrinum Foug A]